MPQLSSRRFRISAIGGTSVTLVPADGEALANDFVGGITSIVINTPGTADTRFADVVNRVVAVSLETK